MTPVELIHTVLCMNAKDMWPDWTKPGGPVVVQVGAAAIAEKIVETFASQGVVIVSAEDLRTVFAHWRRPVTNQLGGQDAYARLRAALPEETTDA